MAGSDKVETEVIECDCPDNGNEEDVVTFSDGQERTAESLSVDVVSPIDYKEIEIQLNADYPDNLDSLDEFTVYLVPKGQTVA